MLKNIRGAIFDMDGTLVNSLVYWDLLWSRLGEVFLEDPSFRPSEADDKAVRTISLSAAMEYIHRQYGIGENGETLFSLANDKLEHFYREEVQLKPGVLPFLDACQKAGVRMCIASASDRRLVKIAACHSGIDGYFEEIFSCADIGKGKDKPDVYLAAQSFLSTKRAETCVFEDSHVAICTAASIGMQTVGIYDPNNYGGEEMAKIATAYIAEGETLEKLLGQDIF